MSRQVRPELLALLDDVKQNPSDLTPWLVLTDWLEEHGDESDRARAEYCRLCFDKLGRKTYASDWEKGERRRELIREWKNDWLGPIAQPPHPPQSWQVRRGLVAVSTGFHGLISLQMHGADDERWEWVEELMLDGLLPNQADDVAACPLLAGPTILHLRFPYFRRIDAAAVTALSQSPFLGRVLTVHLSGQGVRSRNPDHLDSLFRPLCERLGPRLKLAIYP